MIRTSYQDWLDSRLHGWGRGFATYADALKNATKPALPHVTLPLDVREFRTSDQRHGNGVVAFNADKPVATGFKIHWYRKVHELESGE